jgi:hypothetical protein
LGSIGGVRYVDHVARILVVDDEPELAELIQARGRSATA